MTELVEQGGSHILRNNGVGIARQLECIRGFLGDIIFTAAVRSKLNDIKTYKFYTKNFGQGFVLSHEGFPSTVKPQIP